MRSGVLTPPSRVLPHESQIDEIAKELGIDRLEFRRRNFVKTGDTNATQQVIESAVWSDDCMTQA